MTAVRGSTADRRQVVRGRVVTKLPLMSLSVELGRSGCTVQSVTESRQLYGLRRVRRGEKIYSVVFTAPTIEVAHRQVERLQVRVDRLAAEGS